MLLSVLTSFYAFDATRYCVRLTGRLLRREDAIEDALSNKLAQRALKREADAAAAQREIENFT